MQALDLVPKLTDEVMKKIEDIMENKPAPVVCFPFRRCANNQDTFGRDA